MEIHYMLEAYAKLGNQRLYFEGGIPRPISYDQVYEFHSKHLTHISFPLLLAVVGQIDKYELDKEYARLKQVTKQNRK